MLHALGKMPNWNIQTIMNKLKRNELAKRTNDLEKYVWEFDTLRFVQSYNKNGNVSEFENKKNG